MQEQKEYKVKQEGVFKGLCYSIGYLCSKTSKLAEGIEWKKMADAVKGGLTEVKRSFKSGLDSASGEADTPEVSGKKRRRPAAEKKPKEVKVRKRKRSRKLKEGSKAAEETVSKEQESDKAAIRPDLEREIDEIGKKVDDAGEETPEKNE
jgi:hypothetical protein